MNLRNEMNFSIWKDNVLPTRYIAFCELHVSANFTIKLWPNHRHLCTSEIMIFIVSLETYVVSKWN